MGKIVAFANQKGGVGKTTSAVNLAAAVGDLGHSVLLIDLDPQGTTTSGMGVNKRDVTLSTYDLLISDVKAEQVLIRTQYKNLSLLPCNISLAGAELELVDLAGRESRLKNAIAALREEFDFIFIDCPPSLGLLTLNALCACDTLLVPIQCEYFALEGLSQLISTVRSVKRLYNPSLDIEGVLLTMYDGRLNLTISVVEEVKRFFPQKLYRTTIPRNVRISEAPSYGQPIMYYDRSSKGAKSYAELAEEFLSKNRRK